MSGGPRRLEGVDVARGVACVCMFVAHGFDAYIHPLDRPGDAYAVTRWFAKLPLPLFLLLAGVGVALRFAAADRRGEVRADVARAILRRALMILLAGYALSAFMAWLDGHHGAVTLLRADVLHVIALSVALTAVTLAAPTDRRVPRALFVAALLLLPSPFLNRLGPAGPFAPLAALFVEAGAYTVMPLFPLGAWCLGGAALAKWWQRHVASLARPQHRYAPLALAATAALGAWMAVQATHAHMALAGGELSRRHPAVYWNALELFCRALSTLAFAVWCTPRAPAWLRDWLRLLGRHSLLAYAFHLPFAYGDWGSAWHGRLRFVEACGAVFGLTMLTTGAVALRARLGDRVSAWRAAASAGSEPPPPRATNAP